MLIITLVFLGYLLWIEWQKDYGPQPISAPVSSQAGDSGVAGQGPGLIPPATGVPAAAMPGEADVPDLGAIPDAGAPAMAQASPASGEVDASPASRLVSVKTDVLDLQIDLAGGTVVSARLLNYPVDLDFPDVKVRLLSSDGSRFKVAQSGLLSRQAAPNHTSLFSAPQQSFELAPGEDELRVPLAWEDASGVQVTKEFVFSRGRYDIAVTHQLVNNSAESWAGSRYLQLQRALAGDDEKGSGFNNPERYSFKGIGFYNPEDKFEKIKLEDVADEPYQRTASDGWLSMIQHYFFAAWIPPADQQTSYSTQFFTPDGWPRAIARAVSPPVVVSAGGQHRFESVLFIGPKLQDELAGIAPGLDLTVNYGIFTVFSAPLFWLLEKINSFTGNWGWAIVLLTVLIKLAFFKLTEAQYKSMARMRKLQPRMEKLKERYGDDRQAMSQAMMKMYKEEKVNPLGGCLPVLVQIPIFIALYWVLLESVELRQAPFILWIDNLSVRDPFFVLPVLNAAFMLASQRLTPMVGMDPLQRKMLQAMPIVFGVMFAFFPAGLVLYWATNAGLSLAQQWYITRKIEKSDS
jgi:YidC/Oxa1 family membrane protein insertase